MRLLVSAVSAAPTLGRGAVSPEPAKCRRRAHFGRTCRQNARSGDAAATAPRRDRPRLPLILVVDVLSRAAQPVHAERATIVEQHRPAERPKHLVLPAYDNARKVDVVRAVDQRIEGERYA